MAGAFALHIEGETDADLTKLFDEFVAKVGEKKGTFVRTASLSDHPGKPGAEEGTNTLRVHRPLDLDEAALLAAGHRKPAKLDDSLEFIRNPKTGAAMLVKKGTEDEVPVDLETGRPQLEGRRKSR